jgi:hypothetical protein
MKRLVQPELMAGLIAKSVDTGIPAAFAIASHVSPGCTTRVVLQVGGACVGVDVGGGCTRKNKREGERSTRQSSKSLGQERGKL